MSGCLCLTSIPFATDNTYTPSPSLLNSLTEYEFPAFERVEFITIFAQLVALMSFQCSHVLPRAGSSPGDASIRRCMRFAMCGVFQNGMRIYQPRHEYVADTLDGGVADLMLHVNGKPTEQWVGQPGQGRQLPLYADPGRSHDVSPTATLQREKLHAHCK